MKSFSLASSALSVAYSPNGNYLVVGFNNGAVQVLDSANGSLILKLGNHNGSVSYVSYAEDGLKIISASIDGVIKIWSGKDGRELLTFNDKELASTLYKELTLTRYKVASSMDGRYIVSGSGLTVRAWDITNRQLLREFKEVKERTCVISSVAISPDGRRVVAGQDWSKMSCWDIQSGQLVFEKDIRESFNQWQHQWQQLSSVDYNPDGNCIVAGFWDGSIIIFDANNGQEIRQLVGHRKGEGKSCAMVFVKYSSNGQKIVSGSWDCKIKIWEAETGKEVKTIASKLKYHESKYHGSNDTKGLLIPREILFYYQEEMQEKMKEERDNYFREYLSVSYSPNQQNIVSVDNKGTIKIWNVGNGEEIVRFVPRKEFLYLIWDKEAWISAGGPGL